MSTQPDLTHGGVEHLPGGLPAALEAILMVVDEPISTSKLAEITATTATQVESALSALADEYQGKIDGSRPRGFTLRNVAGGWRIYSNPVFADLVAAYVLDGQTARLTQAALETLAIIAYRQPVTRSQISAIRGVNVDGVVRTLVARGLVKQVGTQEVTGALQYATTGYFLERMGISSLDELPPLAPHLPDIESLDAAIKENQ